ncbi:MAG: Gfo/Idh/MocA family oxidoreductase [Planctomycetes bacterium]|nr:Gfo/Idh/MocA family oxidoreductase [Planctomycetota bacterium]
MRNWLCPTTESAPLSRVHGRHRSPTGTGSAPAVGPNLILNSLWLMLVLCLVGPLMAADSPKGLKALDLGKKTKKAAPSEPKELKSIARLTAFNSWITSLAFSPDDKILAVGAKDAVQLIQVETKSVLRELNTKPGQVRALAFSPDGKLLLAGSYQRATVWTVATGEISQELKGHRGYVTSAAFSPDGQKVVTGCEDETARIWSLKEATPILELKGNGLPVNGVAWSPDGTLIAAAIGDDLRPTRQGKVSVWEAATGNLKHEFELHAKAATGVAFSPDGKTLASSSVDEHVNLYDLTDNKPLGFFAGHSRPTNAVLFYPDQETVISISGGRAVGKNELKVWQIDGGEELATVEAHEARITALALSHDGRTVATGGHDNTVVLWNVGFLAIGLPTAKVAAAGEDSAPANALLAADSGKAAAAVEGDPKKLRAGIIGLDTSHAIAFTKTLNAEKPNPAVAGCRMVAVYPKGSPDIESSTKRVPGYIEEMKKLNVEIVDSIEDLLTKVDVVFLETNDGRPHFEQLLPVLKAGKPCFIDKPIAASLTDAVAIFEAARKYNVPIFSSSSLRFGKNTLAVRGGLLGMVKRCETTSPASLEPTHPDLFWYGIHGVESLFTVMGTGCQTVTRGKTADGLIEVTGEWSGGRVGTYREGKGYTGTATGETGTSPVGSYDGYDPLVYEIIKFFRSGQPPVTEQETLEIYAFMEAADESKRQDGAKVTLESVLTKARAEAAKKIAELK